MAINSQRAMLDALMGQERNDAPNAPKTRIKWSDEDVCPNFICGFCPHSLFPSTKNDLGPCGYKYHDDYLRELFLKENYGVQYPHEVKFLKHLEYLLQDLERRMIRHNRNRTDITDVKDKDAEFQRKQRADDLLKINEHINNLKKQILDLIVAKNNTEAASLSVLMGTLEKEQAEKLLQVEEDVKQIGANSGSIGNKRVTMCEVCGAFLVQGDTQERLTGHMEGKQHTGYQKIREAVAELRQKHENYRKNRPPEPPRSSRRSRTPERNDRIRRSRTPDRDENRRGGYNRYSRDRRSRSPRRDYRRSRSRSNDRRRR